MRESADDLRRLQALIDDGVRQASPFLRRSFQMPEHTLSAAALAAALPSALTVAFATVTARGEPRVAPTGALFLRATFYLPTVAQASRSRHLARRPAASLSYHEGIDLAVIAHGHATIVDQVHPDFAELDAAQVQSGGQSVTEWEGDGVYLQLHPSRLYTFARYPDRYLGGNG